MCAALDAHWVGVWVEKFKFELCSNDFQLLSIYYRYNMHCYCSSKCTANNHHIVHNEYYSYWTCFDARGSWVFSLSGVCWSERQHQSEKKISIYNICFGKDTSELCGCTFCALCVSCAILLCFRLQWAWTMDIPSDVLACSRLTVQHWIWALNLNCRTIEIVIRKCFYLWWQRRSLHPKWICIQITGIPRINCKGEIHIYRHNLCFYCYLNERIFRSPDLKFMSWICDVWGSSWKQSIPKIVMLFTPPFWMFGRLSLLHPAFNSGYWEELRKLGRNTFEWREKGKFKNQHNHHTWRTFAELSGASENKSIVNAASAYIILTMTVKKKPSNASSPTLFVSRLIASSNEYSKYWCIANHTWQANRFLRVQHKYGTATGRHLFIVYWRINSNIMV